MSDERRRENLWTNRKNKTNNLSLAAFLFIGAECRFRLRSMTAICCPLQEIVVVVMLFFKNYEILCTCTKFLYIDLYNNISTEQFFFLQCNCQTVLCTHYEAPYASNL